MRHLGIGLPRSLPFMMWAGPIVLAALWGCAPTRVEPTSEPIRQDTVINPPRSARGNPPFYDVLGQRYYVRESSEGYRETGVASWYGQKFHGLPTSSGETYDMYAMTAAHTTLPIPTWVEVTHLGNGKRVIVKVNDRGPFLHSRIIDLSYSAALALDMVREGTARVEVRALGAPSGGVPRDENTMPIQASESGDSGFSFISEAAAATPGPQARPMEQIYIQVGAFAQRPNARALADTLEAAGYARVFIDSDWTRTPVLHRVRIGPFARSDNIADVVDGLSAAGVNGTHLVVEQ